MGQARGIITREELETYGGADIMLLDGASGSTGSGGSASGSSNFTWEIFWNDTGFTGTTFDLGGRWTTMGYTEKFQEMNKNGTLDDWFEGRLEDVETGLIEAAIGTIRNDPWIADTAGCIVYTVM